MKSTDDLLNLQFTKCIFCKRPLSENLPAIKIIEFTDFSMKEEFQSYYAHAKCLYDAILLVQNKEKRKWD